MGDNELPAGELPRHNPQGVPNSSHFTYENGTLVCDGVSLADVAQAHGSPTFVYSEQAISAAYDDINAALDFAPHLIAYAVKANPNLSLLAMLAKKGAGADIVSGGELARCLKAGVPTDRIVFSGVGKRDDEIEFALESGIRAIHVESVPEIDAIERIVARRAERKGEHRPAPIALRVNPEVDPKTHPYIATGLHGTKFGLELDVAKAVVPRILQSKHLRLEGLASHIGSQIADADSKAEAVEIVARFALDCISMGAPIRTLDAGGGWPIHYGNERGAYPTKATFGEAIKRGLTAAGALDHGLQIAIEPGRALVGEAGVLLTRVVFVKEQHGKRFLVVDAAMNDLIRPALYQAHHAIVPVQQPASGAPLTAADVVGPVCESGDFFALERPMPPMRHGDLLAIYSAGAYGMSMASNYNARRRGAEILVKNGEAHLIRDRERYEDLYRGEHIVD